MHSWLKSVIVFAGLAVVSAAVPAAAQTEAPHQYDLTIGDKTYSITEGQPFTVDGPNGGVTAVLKAKTEASFRKYGVQFTYPKGTRVSSDTDSGANMISVDTAGNYLMMILTMPGMLTADQMKALIDEQIKENYKQFGAKFTSANPSPVTRRIAGVYRQGTMRKFTANGEEFHIEVFSFSQNQQTFGFMIQYTTDELKSSEANTTAILNSLQTYERD